MHVDREAWRRLTQASAPRGFGAGAVLVAPAFLAVEACAALVACFHRNRASAAADTTDFFRDRVLWVSRLRIVESEALTIVEQARAKAAAAVRCYFQENAPLGDDGPQIVEWHEGMEMPPHVDNAHPDGATHPTPWRKYAVVVYLNDAFCGGELSFPARRAYVVPATGLMVAFRGSEPHGVTRVRSGRRYTMPSWLTDDPARMHR